MSGVYSENGNVSFGHPLHSAQESAVSPYAHGHICRKVLTRTHCDRIRRPYTRHLPVDIVIKLVNHHQTSVSPAPEQPEQYTQPVHNSGLTPVSIYSDPHFPLSDLQISSICNNSAARLRNSSVRPSATSAGSMPPTTS